MAESVKGLKSLLSQLKDFPKDLEDQLEEELFDQASLIAREAQLRAPIDRGNLRQGIRVEKGPDLTYRVNANSNNNTPYAAYVEFGTGPQVSVPAELADQAAKFRNLSTGSFQEALDSIREWCGRKGIEESAAYPILMSILKDGQRPRPYLYPALVNGRRRFLKEIRNILNKKAEQV